MEQVSDLVAAAIEGVEHNLTERPHKPSTVAALRICHEALLDAHAKLLQLEEFVDLPVGFEKAEQIDFRNLDDSELIEQSRIMSAMHKAGIEIESLEWFGQDELDLASTIGGNYRNFSTSLKAFRTSVKADGGEFKFQAGRPEKLKEFLLTCEKCGAISVSKVLQRKTASKVHDASETQPKLQWKPLPWRNFEFPTGHDFLVIFKKQDLDLCQFLVGDWMTAFVGSVIEDHLRRNSIIHEVFTKVKYRAPVDVISARSDFDVLAAVDGKAFCIECKSGKIDKDNAAEIIKKANEIGGFFKQFVAQINDFRFLLIYDDLVNARDTVEALFTSGTVVPKTIGDVRQTVAAEFVV